MMSLQQIHEHIQQAEQELAKLVEKEKQEQTGKPTDYLFTYEQYFTDAQEWGLNYQHIQAYNAEGAFRSFGLVVDRYQLRVRHIEFGTWREMEGEYTRVQAYWEEQSKKKDKD